MRGGRQKHRSVIEKQGKIVKRSAYICLCVSVYVCVCPTHSAILVLVLLNDIVDRVQKLFYGAGYVSVINKRAATVRIKAFMSQSQQEVRQSIQVMFVQRQ